VPKVPGDKVFDAGRCTVLYARLVCGTEGALLLGQGVLSGVYVPQSTAPEACVYASVFVRGSVEHADSKHTPPSCYYACEQAASLRLLGISPCVVSSMRHQRHTHPRVPSYVSLSVMAWSVSSWAAASPVYCGWHGALLVVSTNSS
jgi:hypothetical protein